MPTHYSYGLGTFTVLELTQMETDSLPEGLHELRNSYLHLMVDEQARLLYSEWVRKPTEQEYWEAVTILVDLFRSKDIMYWIKDTSKLGEVSDEELRWVLYQLFPLAASFSLKKLARISTDEKDRVRFMNFVGDAQQVLNTTIEVRQFKTYHEAVAWIEQGL